MPRFSDDVRRAAAEAGERLVTSLAGVVEELALQRRSLQAVAHRPWPLPRRPWVMGQTWHDLLFAHWAVPSRRSRARSRLAPDRHVRGPGVARHRAVRGRGAHPRAVPPLPWLSRSPSSTCAPTRPRRAARHLVLQPRRRARARRPAARRHVPAALLPRAYAIARAGRGDRVRAARARTRRARRPLARRYGPPAHARRPARSNTGSPSATASTPSTRRRVLRAPRSTIRPGRCNPRTALDLNEMTEPLGIAFHGDPVLHYAADKTP